MIPDAAERIRAGALEAPHGFFTRRGGVSEGPYASLNCSLSSGDDPAAIAANRARVAGAIGIAPDLLLGALQVHGTVVATATAPWPAGEGPKADALVTSVPGLGLGIITADCAPVLFHDPVANVAGAAHAGWRGAAAGILEATLAAMEALGARRAAIRAAIGPCIGAASYEVGDDMRDAVLALDEAGAARFRAAARPRHHLFDLPGYCRDRLARAGLAADAIEAIDADTCADEARFFSHRRRTRAGGGPIGHQISAIRL